MSGSWKQRRLEGLCGNCGKKPSELNFATCKECAEQSRKRYREYREKGQCAYCIVNPAPVGKCCLSCLEKFNFITETQNNVWKLTYKGRSFDSLIKP